MIGTIIFAILVFSIIVLVHEFGHFLTARLFKIKVYEFSVGMGPKIFSKQKGETLYSIRAIPMGGFCSMDEDSPEKKEGAFTTKPWYARVIVLAAGAAMNILLGFIICLAFISFSSDSIASVVVDRVVEGASLDGFLQEGDKIVSLNGTKVNIKKDIDFTMQQNHGEDCNIVIKRDKEVISQNFKPYATQYADGTPAYIVGFYPKLEKATPLVVLKEAFFQTVWMAKIVFVSIGMLLNGEASVNDVSGPVGVVGAMNSTAQNGGLLALLYFAGFISVNIGLMNLLPIPALDGGRIFFVFVELLRGKPIPPEKEGFVHFIGIILLFGIMIFATWNDIMRLLNLR